MQSFARRGGHIVYNYRFGPRFAAVRRSPYEKVSASVIFPRIRIVDWRGQSFYSTYNDRIFRDDHARAAVPSQHEIRDLRHPDRLRERFPVIVRRRKPDGILATENKRRQTWRGCQLRLAVRLIRLYGRNG